MAEEKEKKLLLLSSSTHIVNSVNAQALMRNVLIALAPVTIFGIVIFGWHALFVVLVSVAAAEIAEAVFRLATKREARVRDLSAAVTGLLLALVLPPSTPLWIVALGSIFAIVVAKEFFGGLGANVFNPALIGRAFLLASFPAELTRWIKPAGIGADAVSSATPLGILKEGVVSVADGITHASGSLGAVEYSLGAGSYNEMFTSLFLGNRSGCIGETSVLLILIGAIFLLATQTIDWRAPVGMLVSAAVLSVIVGLNPIFTLLAGGLMFGAVFMATDYVSAPVTEGGKLIFGIGCGIITVLIRKFGAYPEGVMYSILIMNAVTPFLNKILHKKYGVRPKPKAVPVPAGGAK